MTDQTYRGLVVHARGKVERNSRSWNREQTIAVDGPMTVTVRDDGIRFFIETSEGDQIVLSKVLDALHQEVANANAREIERQQREQVAAIQNGH